MEENELIHWMREWFERLLERFDRIDNYLEEMLSGHNMLEGEHLLDNHDVCKLLNVSKRTLQRYRSSGELPYQNIYHKTYYKEKDVEAFIKAHFAKGDDTDSKPSDDTGSDPDATGGG